MTKTAPAQAPTRLVEPLARLAEETTFERLPDEVVASVKQRVLDTLGICLASAADGLGQGVADLIQSWGGSQQAGLVGRSGSFPAPNAALYNGTLAHSLDFDDTHLPSVLHPSANIVPAALAQAQAVGATGRATIAAAAVGYEIIVRLGMAGYDLELGNSVFFEKGWHATSICGALAAAAMGAKLLGLNREGIADAMGIAASMGSGLLEANRAGGSVKQLHCGWAAHSGITAAELASRGYTAPRTILEGRFGFYTAFCDGKFDPSQITQGLGSEWVTPGIFFKPYPSNHFTHAGIDAALAFKAQGGQVDEIEKIELGGATAPLRTIGEPREQKIRPQSGYHARFSGPFAVATALLESSGLGVSFDNFTDDKVRDPKYLELAARVETFVDPECDRIFPNQFPAVLRVYLKSGELWEKRVLVNRGGPDNPLSDQELFLKYKLNAERCLGPARLEQLADAVAQLEKLENVSSLIELAKP